MYYVYRYIQCGTVEKLWRKPRDGKAKTLNIHCQCLRVSFSAFHRKMKNILIYTYIHSHIHFTPLSRQTVSYVSKIFMGDTSYSNFLVIRIIGRCYITSYIPYILNLSICMHSILCRIYILLCIQINQNIYNSSVVMLET